jgi:hypothetical protein
MCTVRHTYQVAARPRRRALRFLRGYLQIRACWHGKRQVCVISRRKQSSTKASDEKFWVASKEAPVLLIVCLPCTCVQGYYLQTLLPELFNRGHTSIQAFVIHVFYGTDIGVGNDFWWRGRELRSSDPINSLTRKRQEYR